MRKHIDVKMHSERMSALRPGLVAALWEPTLRVIKEAPKKRGKSKYPDELVAKLRGDMLLRGMKPREAAQRHGVTAGYAEGIKDWQMRADVEPV